MLPLTRRAACVVAGGELSGQGAGSRRVLSRRQGRRTGDSNRGAVPRSDGSPRIAHEWLAAGLQCQDESVAEEELSFVHEEMLQPQFEQRVADVFRSKER